MIRPAGLVMAVVMVGVTAGTYYGLDYVPPGLMPKAIRRAEAPEPPKLGGETKVADAATASAVTRVEQMEAAGAEEPMTEADLAEEPPPEPTQTAQASEPAPAESAPEPAVAPAPEPEPKSAPAAKPAPAAPEEKPDPGWGKEPAPAAKSAPKPAAKAPAKTAQKSAPAASGEPDVEYAPPKEAASEPTQTASAAPATPAKPKPEADVIKPWWPDPAKMPANQLKLQYAGQVQGQQAVALLFSAPLNVDTLKQHAKIRTADGKSVSGQWELGKNPRLAVFKGVKPGRYTIILEPQVADAKGFMLGTKLQGPVYIQEP